MSFIRFSGESDVYLIETKSCVIECCGCWFGRAFQSDAIRMAEHLLYHRSHGHKVPDRAIKSVLGYAVDTGLVYGEFAVLWCRENGLFLEELKEAEDYYEKLYKSISCVNMADVIDRVARMSRFD